MKNTTSIFGFVCMEFQLFLAQPYYWYTYIIEILWKSNFSNNILIKTNQMQAS